MNIQLFAFTAILYVMNAFKLLPITFNSSSNPQSKIPDKFFAAQIHYSRIPYQYWQHRLQMIKAMGFNALSVYVMWNFHEIEKGKFDFENEDKNLKQFLELSKKYSFYVLLRPGPYVCAEWDFGGLPVRLMSNKNLTIRSNNKEFLDEVKTYFTALCPIIKQHSTQNNGTIILLQIQNEYGYYGSDKAYISALRQIWKDLNVTVAQYYVDPYKNIDKTYWQGAQAIGINGIMAEKFYKKAQQKYPSSYIFGGEIYSGWFTHWGQNWQTKSLAEFQFEFNFLMSYNHSFSMYMAHGGTNFGLWAGANINRDKRFIYQGAMTTYDYDAPINEQGAPTQKYTIFRQMVKKYTDWKLPDVPELIPTMEIPSFTPVKFADLFSNLPPAKLQQVPETVLFEDSRLQMFNQGFALYETFLKPGFYVINITVHDFALIYQDGRFLRSLDRSEESSHIFTILSKDVNTKLHILVEAMGHVNFNIEMTKDFKGIPDISLWMFPTEQHEIQKYKDNPPSKPTEKVFWNIYSIPIDEKIFKWTKSSNATSFPRLFRYTLNLKETNDTYLNMENWGKGYVFVNGRNLGRYWKKGPQQRLYLPGVWLKKGDNDIIVMDLLNGTAQSIKGQRTLKSQRDPVTVRQEKFSTKKLQILPIK